MADPIRYTSVALASCAFALSFGCGPDSPPAGPNGPGDELPILVAVAPGNAVPVADPRFPYAAAFTVQIFGTSERVVEIHEIVVLLENEVVYSRAQIVAAAGSSTVPPNGSLVVPLAIGLTQNGVTAELIVRASTDDGNAFEVRDRLVIVPAQGP